VVFPILAFIYYAISNLIAQRNFQYWYNHQTIQIKKGVWGREQILLNFERVQHVSIKTSPYLRAKHLATLVLHTAGDTVEIPYISLEQANYLADCCLLNIEFDLSSSSFASQ
jgi:membrane protein YdbS with pleckstrin-like domain